MAQTAAHLVDHVMPPVPVRQWVISVPKRLRGMLADRPRAVAALNHHVHLHACVTDGPSRSRKSTRPGANGVVDLSPFEFLDRLADLVPPPRKHPLIPAQRWYDDFMMTTEQELMEAKNWQDVPSDQPRLHKILMQNPHVCGSMLLAKKEFLNNERGSFVCQILRSNAKDFGESIKRVHEELTK